MNKNHNCIEYIIINQSVKPFISNRCSILFTYTLVQMVRNTLELQFKNQKLDGVMAKDIDKTNTFIEQSRNMGGII